MNQLDPESFNLGTGNRVLVKEANSIAAITSPCRKISMAYSDIYLQQRHEGANSPNMVNKSVSRFLTKPAEELANGTMPACHD